MSAIADDIKNDTYRLDTTEPVKQQRSDRDIIAAQVERERQKLVRAKEAYLNGIDTADEYKRNKTAIQEEIDRLQAELDKLPDDEQLAEGIAPKSKRAEYRNNCKRVLTILQDPDIPEPEKNAELKSLIKKAIYDKSNQSITVFYH
jgi:septation ring formation regulator EzrA